MNAKTEFGWCDPLHGGDSHPCYHALSDGTISGLLASGGLYELNIKNGQWLVRRLGGVIIMENDDFVKEFNSTRYEKPNWIRNS